MKTNLNFESSLKNLEKQAFKLQEFGDYPLLTSTKTLTFQ